MSITSLKKLASAAFNVPHAESTTTGLECLHCVCEAARKELEALEKAVRALAGCGIIYNGVGSIHDADEAMQLVVSIAKEAP